jgi:hypothetical protein
MNYLQIHFPEDFEEKYLAYKNRLGVAPVQKLVIQAISNKEDTKPVKPHTYLEDGKGYLILAGEKVYIGSSDTEKFRLIETLCNPFGTAKTLDIVYSSVKAKVSTDPSLNDSYLAPTKKKEALKQTFKEIQRAMSSHRVSGKGKLPKVTFKTDSSKVWLV